MMPQENPHRVLLVQGAEPDRDLLWAFFNGIHCDLEVVGTQEDAITAFGRSQHDLVVTDTKPPRGSGFDIVHELHGMSKKLTPFLFISGTLSEQEALRELDPDLLVVGLLRKPIFIVDLVYKLRDWLRLPEGREFLELLSRLEPGDAGVAALDDLLRDAGDLSRVPFSRVIYAAYETKRTGCLTVATDTGKVHLYFFRGELVYLGSERPQDSLIQSMTRRGMLEVLDLPAGQRPTNLEEETGLLVPTRALLPHKIPAVVETLLVEIMESITRERTGIFRLQPADPPHRFMEAYSPIRLLLKTHDRLIAGRDEYLGHTRDSNIVVRVPLSIDINRWKLPSGELRLANRLRSMVGHSVTMEDFLRVYADGEQLSKTSVRAFLSMMTEIGYLDFRPPRHSDEDLEILRELLTEAHRIRALDHFRLLRVRASDPEEKLKKAFLAASKTYHPDRYYGRPPRIASLAELIQGRYQEAFEILSKENARKGYVAGLSDSAIEQAGVSDRDLHDPGKASILWREAERFMKAGKWDAAQQHLEEARRFDADRPVLSAALGWTLFNLDRRRNRRKALDLIKRAISMNNNCDRAHYYQGKIAMAAGNAARAELYFSRALAANSDNFEAQRELRLLARRTKRLGKEKKGKLADLLTKDIFGRDKKK